MLYEDEARVLLEAGYAEVTENNLYDLGEYVACEAGNESGCLDAHFTARQLRAIAEWMDHPREVAAAYAALKSRAV